MSWSYKIAILYSGFAGLILTLVIISSNNKEELVSKDYYAKELAYQDHINAVMNEKVLTSSLTYQVEEKNIRLTLPSEMKNSSVSGQVNFYCPSSSAKDKVMNMKFNDEGIQIIDKSELQRGIYKMELTWSANGKTFYKEAVINI